MPLNIFSVRSDEQDVQALLDNVAEAVQRWEEGKTLSLDLSTVLGEANEVNQRAMQLKGQWNVNGSAVIHSTRPGLGPWIIRFQNLVRRLTWWYLEPIIQQIRAFQMDAALTASGLAQNQERQLARCEDLTREVTTLQERLEALETRIRTAGKNTNSDAAQD